jgi:hypothetical protein
LVRSCFQATPTDTSGRFPWPGLPPTDVQAYYAIAGGLVQGDQLLAM